MCFTRRRDLAAGCRNRAARHHHAARAPGAGRVWRQRRVAVDQSHARSGSMPSISCATCASVVSRPWPCECAPMRSSRHAIGRERARALLVAGHHRNAPAVVDGRAVRGLLAEDRAARHRCGARPAPPVFCRSRHFFNIERRRRRVAPLPDSRRESKCLLGDVDVRHLVAAGTRFTRRTSCGSLPDLARDRVEHQFQREAHAGARDAAVRAGSAPCWSPPTRCGSDSAPSCTGPGRIELTCAASRQAENG